LLILEDSSIRVILTPGLGLRREGRMDKEKLAALSQLTCNHAKQKHYTQTRFDILNGFELVATKCGGCHKTLVLQVRKFFER
jgi:hypothetical protein